MRQVLLRVPDDLHRRLASRASREGRSVNAVANEILDAAVDSDEGDRQDRLRAKATMLGILDTIPARSVSPAERESVLASMQGAGSILDALLADERDRM